MNYNFDENKVTIDVNKGQELIQKAAKTEYFIGLVLGIFLIIANVSYAVILKTNPLNMAILIISAILVFAMLVLGAIYIFFKDTMLVFYSIFILGIILMCLSIYINLIRLFTGVEGLNKAEIFFNISLFFISLVSVFLFTRLMVSKIGPKVFKKMEYKKEDKIDHYIN